MQSRSIALDGPAGAGKSTLAKKAAAHFNLIYVDTGALYMCVGLYALRKGVYSKDSEAIIELLPKIKIEMKYDDKGTQRMYLGGEDVTEDIRQPEVSAYASDASAIPEVRQFLFDMQLEMAEKYNVVMDGRDIGTVVMPNAGLKIFITADISKRAERRYLELKDKGIDTTFEKVREEMSVRDTNDSEREIAPLRQADDAILLDTTNLDLNQSFEALCELVKGNYGDKRK